MLFVIEIAEWMLLCYICAKIQILFLLFLIEGHEFNFELLEIILQNVSVLVFEAFEFCLIISLTIMLHDMSLLIDHIFK